MARHRGVREQHWSTRSVTVVALFGSALAVSVGAVGLSGALRDSASTAPGSRTAGPASMMPAFAATPAQPPVPTATTAPIAHPVTLRIPSIKVNASMELLGLAGDGTLQTPTDPGRAGWFTGSSLPGEPGPVVIAGHVDSLTGPAVFIHLKNLKTGDPITIAVSGGSDVEYRVTSIVTYAKDKFPTESVYGPRPDSELRLITCGGAFVKGEYLDNVIVFAKLSA